MSYGAVTENMNKVIQSRLKMTTYNATKMYKWTKAMPGLTENIGRGVKNKNSTVLQKADYGQFIDSVAGLPSNTPRFLEIDTELAMIGTKMELPVNYLHRWLNNNLVNVGVNDLMTNIVRSLVQQIDGFMCWGDQGKHYNPIDVNSNEGKFKGIFNMGTDFAAGGGDNIVSAAGDYLASYNTATLALKTAGYEVPPQPEGTNAGYWMFSDTAVENAAKQGNNIYTTYNPLTEKSELVRQNKLEGGLRQWIDSPNFLNRTGTSNYMTILDPYKSSPVPGDHEGKSGETAFKFLQGYDMEIFPLYNGGLNGNMAYEWGILWSGAWEVDDANSIQNSGALTLA